MIEFLLTPEILEKLEFYYRSDGGSRATYNNYGQGEIDLSRIGYTDKVYRQSETSAEIPAKKTILLADCPYWLFAAHLPQVRDFIIDLIKFRFRCVSWLHGELIELNFDNLDAVLSEIKFSEPKRDILKKSHLHPDETLVLDYLTIRRIFNVLQDEMIIDTEDDELKVSQTLRLFREPHCISFEDLTGVPLAEKVKHLERLTQGHKFALTLYDDEFPDLFLAELATLAVQCPNLSEIIIDHADSRIFSRQLPLLFPTLSIRINRFFPSHPEDLHLAEKCEKYRIKGLVFAFDLPKNPLNFNKLPGLRNSVKLIKLKNQKYVESILMLDPYVTLLGSTQDITTLIFDTCSYESTRGNSKRGGGLRAPQLKTIILRKSHTLLLPTEIIQSSQLTMIIDELQHSLVDINRLQKLSKKHVLKVSLGFTFETAKELFSTFSQELLFMPHGIDGPIIISNTINCRLSLEYFIGEYAADLSMILSGQQHTRVLSLTGCDYGPSFFAHLAKCCPHLSTLEMVGCRNTAPNTLVQLPSVERLIVRGCEDPYFTENLVNLFTLAPNATYIEMDFEEVKVDAIPGPAPTLAPHCLVNITVGTGSCSYEAAQLIRYMKSIRDPAIYPCMGTSALNYPEEIESVKELRVTLKDDGWKQCSAFNSSRYIKKIVVTFTAEAQLTTGPLYYFLSGFSALEVIEIIGIGDYSRPVLCHADVSARTYPLAVKQLHLKNFICDNLALTRFLNCFREIETLHLDILIIPYNGFLRTRILNMVDLLAPGASREAVTADVILRKDSVQKKAWEPEPGLQFLPGAHSRYLTSEIPEQSTLHDPHFKNTVLPPYVQCMFSKSDDIQPRDYRHHVLNYLDDEHAEMCVVEFTQDPEVSAFYENSNVSEPYLFIAVNIEAQTTWSPLLTRTDCDKLLMTSVLPPGVQIRHNVQRGQYYIRVLGEPISFRLEYILLQGRRDYDYFPKHPPQLQEIELLRGLRFISMDNLEDNPASRMLRKKSYQERLELYYHFFHAFDKYEEPADLDINEPTPTLFNKMLAQMRGSCGNRTGICDALEKIFGRRGFVILNDWHGFPQIEINGKAYHFDLGGVGNAHTLQMRSQPRSHLQIEPPRSAVSGFVKQTVSASNTGLLSRFFTWAVSPESEEIDLEALMECVPFHFGQKKYVPAPAVDTINDYSTWLRSQALALKPGSRNVAVLFQNAQNRDGFVQQFRASVGERSFVIDNLTDLPFESQRVRDIHDQKEQPEIENIQAPALIQFLALDGENPLVIINGGEISDRGTDILHQLLDTNRQFNNIAIRPDTIFIVVMLEHQFSAQGDALMRRIRFITDCPLSLKRIELQELTAAPIKKHYDDVNSALAIKGKLKATRQGLFYQKSKVLAAKTVTLENTPNHREMWEFLDDANTQQLAFLNGRFQAVPSFALVKKDYEFPDCFSVVTDPSEAKLWTLPLNQFFYPYYLRLYHSSADNIPLEYPSLLKTHHGQTIIVALTENLSSGQWAKLLKSAHKNGCHLKLVISPGVTLPRGMQKNEMVTHLVECSPQLKVLVSSDIDRTAEDGGHEDFAHPTNARQEIFFVGPEVTYGELVARIELFIREQHLRSRFHPGLLLDKKHLVLKGHFNRELAAALASLCARQPFLLVNGELQDASDMRIVVIDTAAQHWNYLDATVITVETLEYSDLFSAEEAARLSFFDRVRIEKYKSILSRKEIRSSTLSLIDPTFKRPKERYQLPELKADFFDAARLQKVLTGFQQDRCVILLGKTGSGKTTFAYESLKWAIEADGGRFYSGLDQLIPFLEDSKPGRKVIYFDEITLLPEDALNALEGFYQSPPVPFYKNKLYPQVNETNILASSNPLSYAGRCLSSFLIRHHYTVNFDLLPEWYLDQTIVESMCASLQIKHNIGKNVLNIFGRYQQQNSETVTSRNLRHMIMTYSLLCEQFPTASAEECLQFAEWFGISSPETLKQLDTWLQTSAVTPFLTSLRNQIDVLKNELLQYEVTLIRSLTLSLVSLLLHKRLREWRLANPQHNNFGLCGLIFRGPPAVCKSLLANAFFKIFGFQEYQPSTAKYSANTLVKISTSDRLLVESRLRQSSENGWVNFIDEINTLSSQAERHLNRALDNIETADHGIWIVGTQNHDNEPGCRKTSPAFQNRFQIIDVCDPTPEERKLIVLNKVKTPRLADALCRRFEAERAKDYAAKCLFPASNGDCFHEADFFGTLSRELVNYFDKTVLHIQNEVHHKTIAMLITNVKPYCELPQFRDLSSCLLQIKNKMRQILNDHGYGKVELLAHEADLSTPDDFRNDLVFV